MKKLLFLIADGMGGLPLDALGGKTTLAAAHTPTLDALAKNALVGLCRTVPEDMHPGSDVANMALMGFDPAKNHTGRGPIEAAAQGLTLDPDDLVFRLNLVSVSEPGPKGRMLDYSSGHIKTDEAAELIAKIDFAIGREALRVFPGVQYRHLLVVKHAADDVEAHLAVRPPHDITGQNIEPDLFELARSPKLRKLFSEASKILAKDNPTKANAVWPWGQGKPLALPDFHQTFGLNGAVVTAVDLVRGLGQAAGMTVLDVPGATGLLDTNYEGKVQAALKFLDSGGDFVFVHVEAPDECGHAGCADDKIEAIARFDARIVKPLVDALGEKAAYLVACDHYTPIVHRTHTSHPVPFLLADPAKPLGPGVQQFTEASAAAANLLLNPGYTLLPWALAQLR